MRGPGSRVSAAPFANLSQRDGIQGRVGCMSGVSQGRIGHGRPAPCPVPWPSVRCPARGEVDFGTLVIWFVGRCKLCSTRTGGSTTFCSGWGFATWRDSLDPCAVRSKDGRAVEARAYRAKVSASASGCCVAEGQSRKPQHPRPLAYPWHHHGTQLQSHTRFRINTESPPTWLEV